MHILQRSGAVRQTVHEYFRADRGEQYLCALWGSLLATTLPCASVQGMPGRNKEALCEAWKHCRIQTQSSFLLCINQATG